MFSETYLKTGRKRTQTRKGTATLNFPEYLIYFNLFSAHLVKI
mgnify:CR=1